MGGNASGLSISVTVSPIVMSGIPESTAMSPAPTSAASALPRPLKTIRDVTFDLRITPSILTIATGWLAITLPRVTRPMPIFPL